jgi:hypothetical protein
VSRRLEAGLVPLLPEESRLEFGDAKAKAKKAKGGFFSRIFRPMLHPSQS